MNNKEVYGDLAKVSAKVEERRIRLVGNMPYATRNKWIPIYCCDNRA